MSSSLTSSGLTIGSGNITQIINLGNSTATYTGYLTGTNNLSYTEKDGTVTLSPAVGTVENYYYCASSRYSTIKLVTGSAGIYQAYAVSKWGSAPSSFSWMFTGSNLRYGSNDGYSGIHYYEAGNGAYYGPGFQIAIGASDDDGDYYVRCTIARIA